MLNLITPIYILLVCFKINNVESIRANENSNSEYNLYTNLFVNYSKSIRPVKNWNSPVQVDINIRLNKISSVIEDRQTIQIYVKLEMIWKDTNLVWDPKLFDGTQSIVVPADQIWIPDIHLFNSAIEDDRIYPINVELYSNGTIVSFPVNNLYAHCDFDFTRFPYDIQKCDFLLGSMIDKSKIKLNVRTFIELSRILPNPEWIFLSLSDPTTYLFNVPGTIQANKEAFNMDWNVAKFSLNIKRVSTFYVNLFVWPLVFIMFIAMSLFILPPSCVERASLGALLILSVVVLSLMLESYMPKSSASVSIIGKLIGFCMFMVTLATVASTLIISVDRDNFVYRHVPEWLKNVMLRYLGKLVFKYGSLNQALGENNLLRDDDIEVIDTSNLLQQQQSSSEQLVAAANNEQQQSTAKLDVSQARTLLILINNQLAMFRTRLQENDLKEKNRNDWYLIATVLDRFCLGVYSFIMLLGLFIVLI